MKIPTFSTIKKAIKYICPTILVNALIFLILSIYSLCQSLIELRLSYSGEYLFINVLTEHLWTYLAVIGITWAPMLIVINLIIILLFMLLATFMHKSINQKSKPFLLQIIVNMLVSFPTYIFMYFTSLISLIFGFIILGLSLAVVDGFGKIFVGIIKLIN
jgi:hypothetical protein